MCEYMPTQSNHVESLMGHLAITDGRIKHCQNLTIL
jgi:hypothetical protein